MAKRNLYIPEQEQTVHHVTPVIEQPKMGTVANCSRLNVRKKPHRGSEVVTIIEEDETVVITMSKSTRNWYYVKTESGEEGYCMADFIVLKK